MLKLLKIIMKIGLGSSSLTLARNQVKYTSPSNFVLETMETEYLECLRSKYYTQLLPFAPFFDNKFVSKDGNCIVFIDVVPVASKDSKFYRLSVSTGTEIRYQHISH